MRHVRFTIAAAGGRTAMGGKYVKGDEVIHSASTRRSSGLVLLKSEVEAMFAKGPEPWFPPEIEKLRQQHQAKRAGESDMTKIVRKLVIKGLKKRPGFKMHTNMYSRGYGHMSFVLRWSKTGTTPKFPNLAKDPKQEPIICTAYFALKDGAIGLMTGEHYARAEQGTFDLVNPKFKEEICGTVDKYLDTMLV